MNIETNKRRVLSALTAVMIGWATTWTIESNAGTSICMMGENPDQTLCIWHDDRLALGARRSLGGSGESRGDRPVSSVIAKNNSSTSKCDNTNPSTANPVVIATGEKWLPQADFESFGFNQLSFSRTYRSLTRPGFQYMFGPGWHSTYDHARLDASSGDCTFDADSGQCVPNFVIIADADGAQYSYLRYANTNTY